MNKTALLFSGQGAQYEGMGRDLASGSTAAKAVYSEAAKVLGYDVLAFDEAALQDTRYAQLATFCLSIASYRALEERLGEAPSLLNTASLAGFSLGEYAALCIAGSLSFVNALELIQKRAIFMSEASLATDGAMYAIIGLDDDIIEDELAQAAYGAHVFPANYNSPGQLVIAGDRVQCEHAAEALLKRGAKRALKLNVSGAFHTHLMASAAEQLETVATQLSFEANDRALYSNVTASLLSDDENLPAYLARHMVSPVRWSDGVRAMQSSGIERYIEFGPGKTLLGLVKRVDRRASLLNVQDMASLDNCVTALSGVFE